MGIEFTDDKSGRQVTFRGVFRPAEARDALAELAPDRGDPTHTILDMSEVIAMDTSAADVHQLLVRLRAMYPRGPGYRYAVVAPSRTTQEGMEWIMEIRDLLLGRDPAALPAVEVFQSLDEARAWARPAPD